MERPPLPQNQIIVNSNTWHALIAESDRKNKIMDIFHDYIENLKKDLAAKDAIIKRVKIYFIKI